MRIWKDIPCSGDDRINSYVNGYITEISPYVQWSSISATWEQTAHGRKADWGQSVPPQSWCCSLDILRWQGSALHHSRIGYYAFHSVAPRLNSACWCLTFPCSTLPLVATADLDTMVDTVGGYLYTTWTAAVVLRSPKCLSFKPQALFSRWHLGIPLDDKRSSIVDFFSSAELLRRNHCNIISSYWIYELPKLWTCPFARTASLSPEMSNFSSMRLWLLPWVLPSPAPHL